MRLLGTLQTRCHGPQTGQTPDIIKITFMTRCPPNSLTCGKAPHVGRIFSPGHWGQGDAGELPGSKNTRGSWVTPLGRVKNDPGGGSCVAR
jgi:hypothetical protein